MLANIRQRALHTRQADSWSLRERRLASMRGMWLKNGLRSHDPVIWLAICAFVAAEVGVGFAAGQFAAAAVALVACAPILSHVRWVGARRAISEPSAATVILIFYVFVFPLRGLQIALSDYKYVNLAIGVGPGDLGAWLALAGGGTTAFIESFHYVARARTRDTARRRPTTRRSEADRAAMSRLTSLMGFAVLVALFALIHQYGGLNGVRSAYVNHDKAATLLGVKSLGGSLWTVFAAPAVWCCAWRALQRDAATAARVASALLAAAIIALQLAIFGSRLNAILALTGVWVIAFYTGWRVPISRILIAIPLMILLSVPIVSERPGGSDAGVPTVERYSRIAGYGELDASLAVRKSPTQIRAELIRPSRWLALPAYFVPGGLWPGRPNIETQRLDLIVAQKLGDQNQQTTGFPTTYLTEWWLIGGASAVVVASVLFGALVGRLHAALIGAATRERSAIVLLSYCFVVTTAFSYYKDGDLLMTSVGTVRLAVYLGVAALVTGVWRGAVPALRKL